jgi:hypothetical protein
MATVNRVSESAFSERVLEDTPLRATQFLGAIAAVPEIRTILYTGGAQRG